MLHRHQRQPVFACQIVGQRRLHRRRGADIETDAALHQLLQPLPQRQRLAVRRQRLHRRAQVQLLADAEDVEGEVKVGAVAQQRDPVDVETRVQRRGNDVADDMVNKGQQVHDALQRDRA
ncbi:hypothetical protein D3C72_2114600 [compost metagenome]